MKIRTNLATTPLENNRRFLAISGVVGLLAFLALVFLCEHAYHQWRADRALRADISRLEAEIRVSQDAEAGLRTQFKSPKTLEVMDRAEFLNSLIEQRSFPWTKMFTDLEHLLPPGVRVVSIAPQMKDGKVRVTLIVGAQTDEEKLKFLQALESSSVFSEVMVQEESHPQHLKPGDADRVVLALQARYATS